MWARLASSRVGRALIVVGYVVGFWVLLPAVLWSAGAAVDDALGWQPVPWWGGWAVLAGGLGLIGWAMAVLWRHGRGLAVSALPPARLTRRGPYARMRHPVYVGFNVAVFGAGLALGSRGLAFVVAPLLLPLWIGYALLEERGLARRFGAHYARYRRDIGILPRPGIYRATQLAQLCRVMDTRVVGCEHIPRNGPAVVIHNHACYLDPGFVGAITWRPIHFLTTAEAYRRTLMRWVVRAYVNVPIRRYRADLTACREMLRLLDEGAVVAIAVEGERAVLGRYQGALEDVARIVARLGVPVVPVAMSGAYDAGPRWADTVRRRPVVVRAGPPLHLGDEPARTIDRALRDLLDADPQPVHLDGLPLARLERVLWRCPACGREPEWRAAALACEACGARYVNTPEGWFADRNGTVESLATLGERVRAVVDHGPLDVTGSLWRERSIYGPIEPLALVGTGTIRLTQDAIAFDGTRVAVREITSISTERADTLQVATRDAMWQVHVSTGSAFRLALAVTRWRAVHGPLRGRAFGEPLGAGSRR